MNILRHLPNLEFLSLKTLPENQYQWLANEDDEEEEDISDLYTSQNCRL